MEAERLSPRPATRHVRRRYLWYGGIERDADEEHHDRQEDDAREGHGPEFYRI